MPHSRLYGSAVDLEFFNFWPDKESSTATKSLQKCRIQLEMLSHDSKTLKRVHHDKDGSFDGDFKKYLLNETIEDTNTSGYRPNNCLLYTSPSPRD